jgi:hypothetical protein
MRAIRPLQGLRTIEPVFILQRAASGRIEVAMQGREYLIVRLVIGRVERLGREGLSISSKVTCMVTFRNPDRVNKLSFHCFPPLRLTLYHKIMGKFGDRSNQSSTRSVLQGT